MMYFEIYHNLILKHRGTEILDGFGWANELMYVPDTTITLPIDYRDKITGHDEVKIFVNNKVFHGIVQRIVEDKANEVLEVDLDHIMREWDFRQISVNNAVKDQRMNVVYKGSKIGTKDGLTFVAANPFTVSEQEYGIAEEQDPEKKFTDAQYIERAGAVAWYYTGESLPIDKVEIGERPEKPKEEWSDPQEPEYENYFDAVFHSGTAQVTVRGTIRNTDEEIENETNEEPSIIDQLEDIYNDANFAVPGWELNYSGGAGTRIIDYVYSRQTKLEALTKTMELTWDLHWRTRPVDGRVVDIGPFGDVKDFMLSTKPSHEKNARIIEDPVITHEFEHVFNVASVYSDKSDSGMSSLTLREVYNDPTLQRDGFPVVILRANVNNERNYKKFSEQYPKLAPNNENEYAVIDEESIALESGVVIEGTITFNDLAPFTPEIDDDTQEISDKDRIKAAQVAYDAAIRKLKEARRYYSITFTTEELPTDINPGDKVRLVYDNSLYILEECSAYMKKILSMNDNFVVTRIEYDIDVTGAEVDRVTLEPFVRIARDVEEFVWYSTNS